MKKILLALTFVSVLFLLTACDEDTERIGFNRYYLVYETEEIKVYMDEDINSVFEQNNTFLETTANGLSCSANIKGLQGHLVVKDEKDYDLMEAFDLGIITDIDIYNMHLHMVDCRFEDVVIDELEYDVIYASNSAKILYHRDIYTFDRKELYVPIPLGIYGIYKYDLDEFFYDMYLVEIDGEYVSINTALISQAITIEELVKKVRYISKINFEDYNNYMENIPEFLSSDRITKDDMQYGIIYEFNTYKILRNENHSLFNADNPFFNFVQLGASDGIYYYMKKETHDSYLIEFEGEYLLLKDAVYRKIVPVKDLIDVEFNDLLGH